MTGSCKDMARVKALPEGEYDVVIVGAGCVGASVARELSKFAVKVKQQAIVSYNDRARTTRVYLCNANQIGGIMGSC